jgi:hypothetical protein
MLATVVETKELLQSVVAALIAGIGVTTSFSLLIFGAIRGAELRRDERPLLATAAGALATLGLAVTIAAIVLGIVAMTTK